jgi:FkbM family methyltransferase
MTSIKYLPELYRKYFSEKASVIFDIGSRDGDDAAFLSKSLNTDKVYIFECHPECFKNINNKYPHFNNINVAISNFCGRSNFNALYTNLGEMGISSLRNRNDDYYTSRDTRTVEVEVSTIKNMIEKYNIDCEIDLCKVDVEGCTYEVLEGFEEKIDMVKMFHLEVEEIEIWNGQKVADDIVDFMKNKNFDLVLSKRFAQSSLDLVWINKKLT